MSGPTKIEWAAFSWNPITGCTKVSEGCRNCYAERQAKRFAGRAGYPAEHPFAVTLHPDQLDKPLHWRKPRRIFVCSMSDLFHPDVPDEFINRVLNVVGDADQHTFQILTKRPERMAAYFARHVELGATYDILNRRQRAYLLENLWLGTSIEDQRTADERIPHLLRCAAARRFVVYEPALGPVNFLRPEAWWLGPPTQAHGMHQGLDWVIAGGESGPKARPAHPDWFRSVRDQCQEAGVPFFFKQWGEWVVPNATVSEMEFVPKFKAGRQHPFDDGPIAMRVGKRAAGRLLDGVEHNAYPGEGTP
jgi:protein gp37